MQELFLTVAETQVWQSRGQVMPGYRGLSGSRGGEQTDLRQPAF